jgi:hypothetical protein
MLTHTPFDAWLRIIIQLLLSKPVLPQRFSSMVKASRLPKALRLRR